MIEEELWAGLASRRLGPDDVARLRSTPQRELETWTPGRLTGQRENVRITLAALASEREAVNRDARLLIPLLKGSTGLVVSLGSLGFGLADAATNSWRLTTFGWLSLLFSLLGALYAAEPFDSIRRSQQERGRQLTELLGLAQALRAEERRLTNALAAVQRRAGSAAERAGMTRDPR